METFPFPSEDPFLALVQENAPQAFRILAYGYAVLWFSTPLLLVSLAASLLTIVAYRSGPSATMHALPPYPQPETRQEPSLVLGETHFHTKSGRAPDPTWLEIPRRGLYAGVLILGATGTGKTSACMYPFVDQLLRWQARDPDRKVGGLVLEVKGDFCHEVRAILERAGREDDYLEISLQGDLCYNPLHNDLDPHALAYAIAALANNLFGRSKEPFWQQAYVDLVRNLILLRRLSDGYTNLSDLYRYVLDEAQIDRELRRLTAAATTPTDVLVVSLVEQQLHCRQTPWTRWRAHDEHAVAHPYDAELESFLAARQVAYRVEGGQPAAARDYRHQLDAVDRWFRGSWVRLDARLRSSIVEGIVVLLGSFDAQPDLFRIFCPPRSAYTHNPPLPGALRPIPPLRELLESGKVLALNFPAATNPMLARMILTLLKLDYLSSNLRRIAAIAAAPDRTWRDNIFVCDEYQAVASVGETDPTGDERALAMSRQARLMPIVALPSLSALRAALPGDESWRALTTCFRTTIALAANDEFTARALAERCGRRDRLKPRFTVSEASQQAHISLLTAKATGAKQTLSASKSYALEPDYIFPPRTFTELRNAQAIVLPYDGTNPLPPQFCYLKPNYLDVNIGYFDQLSRGKL